MDYAFLNGHSLKRSSRGSSSRPRVCRECHCATGAMLGVFVLTSGTSQRRKINPKRPSPVLKDQRMGRCLFLRAPDFFLKISRQAASFSKKTLSAASATPWRSLAGRIIVVGTITGIDQA